MRRVVARSFANVLRLNLETFGAGEKVSEETMKNVLVAVNALLEQDHAMYDVLVDALVGSSFPFSVLVNVLLCRMCSQTKPLTLPILCLLRSGFP